MVALGEAYSNSLPLFVACVVIIVYMCNTVLIFYAPLISDIIQLVAMSMRGELNTELAASASFSGKIMYLLQLLLIRAVKC